MSGPGPRDLPAAEDALTFEWAARRELIRRKLQKIQHRDERPRGEEKGVDRLVELWKRDGYL